MQSKSAETGPRNFNPMSVPALSEEARKAVNAAFDAMSAWRTEMVSNSEKNSAQVIEKMAAAARALGWPDQIVEATRTQMQSITKTQIETMDHVMDAWEEQIKSPNPASAMLSKLKSLPSLGSAGGWPMLGFGPAGGWPNAEAFQMAATDPLRFYMQFAEQCQKGWADAMAFWVKAGKLPDSLGQRRH